MIKSQAKFFSSKQDFLAQWQSTELAIKGPAARFPVEANSFKWTLLLVAVTVCRKEYSKEIKKSKRASWRKFTSECEDIYLLNKIIHNKQQNSISMMEGCNTGQQTNNVLLDTHFPGSIPLDNIHQTTSSQKDIIGYDSK